jgi:hypothetical protein
MINITLECQEFFLKKSSQFSPLSNMVFDSYLCICTLRNEHYVLKVHVIPMVTIPKVKENRSLGHSNINGTKKNKQLISNNFT